MKFRTIIAAVLALVLMCCVPAFAEEEIADRFCDVWVIDGFAMEISYDEDGFSCSAVGGDGGDVSEIWEFSLCIYDAELDALVCAGCSHCFEHYDEDAGELVQEDWSISDLDSCVLALDGETDTLVVTDMPFTDGEITLQRLSAAEEEDYEEAQNFLGTWVCDRATIEVTENEDAAYRFTVSWAGSAFEEAVWTYDCAYYGEYREMRNYEGGVKRVDTYGEDGEVVSSETVYEDGEVTFMIDGSGALYWNDITEAAGADMAFERGDH